MNKIEYTFVYAYNNQEIYYCSSTKEFLACNTDNQGNEGKGKIAALTSFIASIAYIISKYVQIEFSFRFVIIHMIIGFILALVCEKYVSKGIVRRMANAQKVCLKEQREEVVKEIRRKIIGSLQIIFWICVSIVAVPFLMVWTENVILFLAYFLCWFMLGIVLRYSGLFQRLEAIKMLKSMEAQ